MNCQSLLRRGAVLGVLGAALTGRAEPVTQDILRSPETEAAVRYTLTAEDQALLDEVQRGCFLYFWRETGATGLAKDRKLGPVSSIAAVGFQLSALPIGVERGWISRAEGQQRAVAVLRTLVERTDNKKFGLYYHYANLDDGGPSIGGYERVVSTVDSALLMAGAVTASEYFGDEVRKLVEPMLAAANWRAFATGPQGRISMGWQPQSAEQPTGEGSFLSICWTAASDEERLVYFLAAGAESAEHAVEPRAYFGMDRPIKRHADLPPFVVSPQGTLFHYFFSHCWIDYRSLGADDPRRCGVNAPRVDWFENSRRAVLTQRRRCQEMKETYKTLGEHRWGLSACVGRDGYLVPEIQPNMIDKEQWYAGTVAPYAAASAIMFAPAESLAAMREMRSLRGPDGRLMAWRDPGSGGFGFVDAFNLDQNYTCDDCVGIDHGPMLLAIENVRSGLIWKLFMRSATARRAVERLQLAR